MNSCIASETILYQSDKLIIKELTSSVWIHTSLLEIPDYGAFPCNGIIFIEKGKAIVIDTPVNDSIAQKLIHWLNHEQGIEIVGVVATHFHNDCLGGLKAFHEQGITSYGSERTIELAKKDSVEIPQVSFREKKELSLLNKEIVLQYLGAGHTEDNIVAFIPSEKVLFGGCLVKALNASKGNLEDANVTQWSNTIQQLKQEYKTAKHVVPGHGKEGGLELLNYTEKLFRLTDD